MLDMFKNYKFEDRPEPPKNIVKLLNVEEVDDLVIGASNIYYFELPIEAEHISNYSIRFKQGLSIVLEKQKEGCEILEYDKTFFVRCEVTPEESDLFNDYNKDTHTQLSITLTDGTIVFSDKYRLNIVGTIK